MIKRWIVSLILSASFLAAPAVYAADYVIDRDYSSITFKINHLMGYVMGNIPAFSGTIKMDEKDRNLAGLESVIDIASLNTYNPMRDEDLRSERFFHVEKYPQATFVAKEIKRNKVTGDLTLRGVTKEVTMDMEFLGKDQDQYGRTKVAFSLKGKINRQDFGITTNVMSQNGKPILGDEVILFIELYGVQK